MYCNLGILDGQHSTIIPYKTIYCRGINIGDWRFFRKFANIKIANINNYMDTPTKPLQKLEKKDMVAQIANIKSANCFLQTNLPNITLANKYSCTVQMLEIHVSRDGKNVLTFKHSLVCVHI